MASRSSADRFDLVVIGGGPAGLNAALVLARARRSVVVLDSGAPRNAASHAMHGFLSRDGLDPVELRRLGRAELAEYPSAQLVETKVVDAAAVEAGFRVSDGEGRSFVGRKLLLALGVRDELPRVDGFDAVYGQAVFHCQYCDGWEVRNQPLAALGRGPGAMRLALLLLDWSADVVLCTDGPTELSPAEVAHLASQGVQVREDGLARLEGRSGQLERIVFDDGSALARRALFFHGAARVDPGLPAALGCTLTEAGRIEVDEAARTSVGGVYAAGDAARRPGQHPASQVIVAAASGALAAIAIHQDLMQEDVGVTPALPRPADP